MDKKEPNRIKDWAVIVNPNAGRHKIEKDWDKISDYLVKTKLKFQFELTQHKEHAIELTIEYIKKGFRKFIVAGGDGTLNEVVNGIFRQNLVPASEFLIAMIPVGTGNDWCRMWNIPFKYKKAIKVIKKEKTFVQDIGKVNYYSDDTSHSRYFINVAGMGYDALVAAKTNRDKERGKGTPFTYMKNLLTSLLFYKFSNVGVKIDESNDELNFKTFSLSVGICKYNGGGMMQLPNAIPDDGLLDMTLIKKLSRFNVIKSLKKLFDGTLTEHPKVVTFKGSTIHIESEPKIFIEADGESIGHSPAKFEIIPKSLRVVVGKTKDP